MPCRAGITTRPKTRKGEWKLEYPNMWGWELHGPFDTREDAQAWEDHQTQCIRHGGGKEPDDPDAKWYGYIFRH